jgi:hypothetical protein
MATFFSHHVTIYVEDYELSGQQLYTQNYTPEDTFLSATAAT